MCEGELGEGGLWVMRNWKDLEGVGRGCEELVGKGFSGDEEGLKGAERIWRY